MKDFRAKNASQGNRQPSHDQILSNEAHPAYGQEKYTLNGTKNP